MLIEGGNSNVAPAGSIMGGIRNIVYGEVKELVRMRVNVENTSTLLKQTEPFAIGEMMQMTRQINDKYGNVVFYSIHPHTQLRAKIKLFYCHNADRTNSHFVLYEDEVYYSTLNHEDALKDLFENIFNSDIYRYYANNTCVFNGYAKVEEAKADPLIVVAMQEFLEDLDAPQKRRQAMIDAQTDVLKTVLQCL